MNIVGRADKIDIAVSAVVVGNRLAGLDVAVYLHVTIPRHRSIECPRGSSQIGGVRSIDGDSPVGRDNDGHPRGRVDADILRRRRIRHALCLGNG